MPSTAVLTRSAEETITHGKELAARLRSPILVMLSGELGAGKTTLAKGIVSGLGAGLEEEVTSPSFTLIHVYHPAAAGKVYHIDLYRVGDFHDLETLGLEDVLSEPAIVLVEWPERLTLRTDWPVLRINVVHLPDDSRRIEIEDAQSAPATARRDVD
jgi:tRNA threonylcarbamoyladenosine biosynthesis protein TsaE